MPSRLTRRSTLSARVIALGVVGALAFAAIEPSLLHDAWAQTQDTTPVSAIQTPSPGPGLTYPEDGSGSAPLTDSALAPATPAVPALPGDASGAPGLTDTGDGLTTNLGGSDVAVASEGGSYEVDGPRRKGKRFPAPTPKP